MKVLMVGGTEARKNWKGYLSCDKKSDRDKPGCGAVLEVEEGDLYLMYWEDGSSQHYYVAVRCPECGKYIEAKHVPKPMVERLVNGMSHGRAIFDGYSQEGKGADRVSPS
jgi:hypothetical protein